MEMDLLIELGFRLGFVPIFHFPVLRARFPLPVLVSRFPLPVLPVSNIIIDVFTSPHRYIYPLFFTGLNTVLIDNKIARLPKE